MALLVTTTDLAAWAAAHGVTLPSGSTLQETALTAAIAQAQVACGRKFAIPASDDDTEEHDFPGNGEPVLNIDDLLQLDSITVDGGEALAEYTFTLDAVLTRPYVSITRYGQYAHFDTTLQYAENPLGVWTRGTIITVTGLWGYAAALPADVQESICALAAVRLLGANDWSSLGISKTTVINITVEYAPSTGSRLAQKQTEALTLLRPHRRTEPEPHLMIAASEYEPYE